MFLPVLACALTHTFGQKKNLKRTDLSCNKVKRQGEVALSCILSEPKISSHVEL